MEGLTSLKNSIETGVNLSQAYPEYEKQYLSYVYNLNSLQTDYETQKKSTEIDATIDSVEYAKSLLY